MTPKTYDAPSVRQLSAVVDEMAGTVSKHRLRQLRMVVDMFDRAVGRDEMPVRSSRAAAQLFTWAALDVFWDLALDGELRAWAKHRGRPLPLNTQHTVVDCLRLLAGWVVPGKRVRLPRVVTAAPRATTTGEQERELFRFLVDLAGRQPVGYEGLGSQPSGRDGQSRQMAADYRVRLLAMTGVVVDTRSRRGELARMRVADLGEGLSSVRVMRRPQNGAHLEPVEVVLPLSGSTVAALGRWLRVRDRLVRPLEGSVDAVWVSAAVSNRGEPPGLPLSAQSLGASYARGVRVLNDLMAGQPGWEPLPDRLEGLRRARVPEEEVRVRRVREAEWEAVRPRRPAGRPRLPEDRPVEHGRESSYTVWGCRCAECTEAASNARQARRRSPAG